MKLNEHSDSDLSETEEQYTNLANAVSLLDSKRRVKAPTRKELSSVVSEFYLPKGTTAESGDVVNVNELTRVLRGNRAIQSQISKVKDVIEKAKTLPKPLEKPVADKIKRAVGYTSVKGQLKKWNAVVEKNRVADHLSFPLQQGRVTLMSSVQFLNKFKPQTPLEIEMTKILGGGEEEDMNDKDKEHNENLEFPLTLEEMMEKKKELAQLRAKMSYQEARAHRQGKIKSKKYHRILKREKIKQQLKEFEQLQKTDPAAALKKLEELDKNRALERASLRHKNTGKWAKNLAIRAKYNKESRKVLAEQLKLSRDLTEKVKKNADSEDEASDQDETHAEVTQDEHIFASNDNPWAIKVSSEVSNFASDVKKYWEDKNKEKASNEMGKTDTAGSVNPSSMEEIVILNGESGNPDANQNIVEKGNEVDAVGPLPGDKDSATHQLVNHTNGEKSNCESATINWKSKRKSKDIVEKVGKDMSANRNSETRNMKINEEGKRCKKPDKNKKVTNNFVSTSNSSNLVKEEGKAKKAKGSGRDLNELSNDFSVKKSSNQRVSGKASKDRIAAKISSTSGTWEVHDISNDLELKESGKRKNAINIDDLFDDLDDQLTRRTTAKIAKLAKQKTKAKKTKKKKSGRREDAEDLSMKRDPQSVRPDVDVELAETVGRKAVATSGDAGTGNLDMVIPEADAPPEIDPKKFIEVKPKKLNTKLPGELTGDDNFIDDEETTQRMNIVEAFDADDVMEEFKEMKKEEEEATKLEVPGELPGWGSWGGAGVVPEKKKRRFMVNVPKLPPRKDQKLKDTIIRENANPKIIEHLVKDVPHPFRSVGAFESNLRHPIGREWVPETAHRKFIQKPVETLMGAIIEPMDENELLRLKKERKSLYKGKKKENK